MNNFKFIILHTFSIHDIESFFKSL